MALEEGQVQVRDLVMGPGTPYTVNRFNPFTRQTRASQGAGRTWNHGTWSGAEWADEKVVPIRVVVGDDPGGMASWVELDQQLAEAFSPVGDLAEDIGLVFRTGGSEYVLFGRPRSVVPDTDTVGLGWSSTELVFVATDPLIYSSELVEVTTGLPTFTGGLTVPFTVPLTVDSELSGGREVVLNDGRAPTGLFIRIDGPVQEPRVVLQTPDGEVRRLRFDLELLATQWLEIDTAEETAFLNGRPQSSRLGQTEGDFFLLPPGESVLRFNHSGDFNSLALVTASYRHAWW